MNSFLDENSKQSIKKVVLGYKEKRQTALDELGLTRDEFRDQMTKIRQKVFDNFEENLQTAISNLQKNGFSVHRAKDAGEAQDILQGILENSQAVVKSKTNLGKEIEIERLLDKLGFSGYETDLGDSVIELLGAEDQHYVLPALHITSQEISAKIKEKHGDNVAPDPSKLTDYLCAKIREKILQADVGITGANFFTQTGQAVLLENEGNISLVSRLPRKHLIVCGIDKLAGSIEDATRLCRAAAIFGTGQNCAQYISIISGPSKTADIENELVEGAQGAKEVHIILVDNGRREMLKSGIKDMLRCISCGACINFCPVYHQKGKKYGGKFAGSKGIIMAANLGGDASLEKAKEAGSFSCTLCDACWKNCPMKISLMHHVREIRQKQQEKGLQTDQNKQMLDKMNEHGNPFGKQKEGEIPDKLYCC